MSNWQHYFNRLNLEVAELFCQGEVDELWVERVMDEAQRTTTVEELAEIAEFYGLDIGLDDYEPHDDLPHQGMFYP